ncbi:MAG: FAD binding domain-containing protein [Anaerolineales bacterium]
MKPPPFEYLAPHSLDAALNALKEHGDQAKILAGGQSLIPAMNFRLLEPSLLMDINPVTELDYIRPSNNGGIRIGAMTRQSSVEKSPLVAEKAPLLHETMPFIAHPQIRNRGTIGGSLAHADPASELPTIAVALDTRFHVQSASGDRWINGADFFPFMFTPDLNPDEILTEIEIPPMPANTGWSFVEFARRRGDYALAGVAALLTLDESQTCTHARLVYLNLGDGPVDAKQAVQALLGQPPTPDRIGEAARIAAEKEIDPMGSIHAIPQYQRHLARVLTVSALKKAYERARGK